MNIYVYNIHSLQSEERFDLLYHDLDEFDWDIIIIVETWRETRREKFTTKRKHFFCGGGGIKGKRGVGFLIKNHKVINFKVMSERLSLIDIIVNQRKIRLLGVYMPHCGYADAHIEAMYSEVDVVIGDARQKGMQVILAGDFNAEVGRTSKYVFEDNQKVIGESGLDRVNGRGEWLVNWAAKSNLCIANTFFTDDRNYIWTYSNGGVQRQLDYFSLTLAF